MKSLVPLLLVFGLAAAAQTAPNAQAPQGGAIGTNVWRRILPGGLSVPIRAGRNQSATVTNADGRQEMIYIAPDDSVRHVWQVAPNGTWHNEAPLNGRAKQIVATHAADGRLAVFYIGMDDRIWHNWQTVPNGAWNGEILFGRTAKEVSVSLHPDGAMELFYTGLDGSRWHNWQLAPNGQWHGEAQLDVPTPVPAPGAYDSLVSAAYDSLGKGLPQEALADAKRAINLDKTRWAAPAVAGLAAEQLLQFDAAIEFLNQALPATPATSQSLVRDAVSRVHERALAENQFLRADYEAAARSFDAISGRNPELPDVSFRAATAWTLAGKPAQAKTILEDIFRHANTPATAEMARNLLAVQTATQARQDRDFLYAERALEGLQGAVRGSPEWLLESAQTKLSLNRRDDALRDFELLGKILPNDRHFIDQISRLRADQAMAFSQQQQQQAAAEAARLQAEEVRRRALAEQSAAQQRLPATLAQLKETVSGNFDYRAGSDITGPYKVSLRRQVTHSGSNSISYHEDQKAGWWEHRDVTFSLVGLTARVEQSRWGTSPEMYAVVITSSEITTQEMDQRPNALLGSHNETHEPRTSQTWSIEFSSREGAERVAALLNDAGRACTAL